MYIRHMKRLLICFILLSVTPLAVRAQQWSGIIDRSRAVDWSTAGGAGGLSSRTTICTTVGTVGELASFAQKVGVAQPNSAPASFPSGQKIILKPRASTPSRGITLR